MEKKRAKILLSIIILVISYFIGESLLQEEPFILRYIGGLSISLFTTIGLFSIGYVVFWILKK